jgi:hypothetical protein
MAERTTGARRWDGLPARICFEPAGRRLWLRVDGPCCTMTRDQCRGVGEQLLVAMSVLADGRGPRPGHYSARAVGYEWSSFGADGLEVPEVDGPGPFRVRLTWAKARDLCEMTFRAAGHLDGRDYYLSGPDYRWSSGEVAGGR